MNNEVKVERITETDRQLLLSGLIATAINIQFMEGRHNIENASEMIAEASKQIKRMVRAVNCGHPVEYVKKQPKQKN
ncbi:hypothetical protein [Pseudomonas yangonensis]|uniref:hypothetical protein n=1 Tax=Pseudomonas yangonensis TaxID=2579922 RepID=UPI00137985B9|nr:hypothetical protein [Pseudomonas yangonensis]